MAADEVCRQAEFVTQGTHFVFEEFAQRFDQLKAHFLWQATDVVVAFDGHRGAAGEGYRLDHVRIERALGQEFGALDLVGVFLEHINEELADDLTFGFRVGLTVEFTKEKFGFIRVDHLQVHVVAEHADHFVRLVFAQQAVVDKHTGELVADGFMQQGCSHGAVNAARQRTDDVLVANLGFDLLNHLGAVGAHGPVAFETGQFHKVLIELCAVWSVVHFWVELHRIKVTLCVGGDSVRCVGRGAVDLKARCDFANVITVGHPDLLVAFGEPAVENVQRLVWRHIGAAKFGGAVAAFDVAAQLGHHGLLTVADAKDWHAIVKYLLWCAWRTLAGHAVRATGEDHSLGRICAHEVHVDVLIRVDFTVDVQLAQATGDQLGDLAAEVNDKKAVV
mmetsp:Transcript_11559/g.18596  ORF Transcript_11559/g.18596 Transcript_11559/m.18596 type:complete len:391 (-) Transcript_11559:6-1178(-)